MRTILSTAALILFAMAGFLFSPRIPYGEEDVNCVSVTDVGPMHIHKNCDSEEFQYVAAHPDLLLSRQYRQSRPLYAVIGWTLARPFHWLGIASVGRGVVADAKQTYRKSPSPGAYMPEYAGLVLFNLLLLTAAVILFLRLSGARRLFDPVTLLPLAIMIVNEVTKAFFWTPHTEMINVLIPMASVAAYRWMLARGRDITWGESVALGVLIGVGALAYGGFAVMAAGAGLCVFIVRWKSILKGGLLVMSFFLPAFAWIAFVRFMTGNFYSLEINLNRDFVWIIDLFRAGNSARIFWTLLLTTEAYGETIRDVCLFPLLILGLLSALLASRGRLRETIIANRTMLVSVAVYLVPAFFFFWTLGLYYSRLTWSLVPPLALMIAVATRSLIAIVSERGKSTLRFGCVVATACYSAFWYFSSGPWS
ncbi:MAG TPA: hypothetical protein VM099_04110 [Gemmatimonadaceae bacterium]|nr:hypothetical protein [Gemmatimonadaceae bacterium]